MWYDILACVLWSAVLVATGYVLGRYEERRDHRAREEAIKAQAYKDGRKSICDEHNERVSMMAPELWEAMKMGVWTAPEKHETKEK